MLALRITQLYKLFLQLQSLASPKTPLFYKGIGKNIQRKISQNLTFCSHSSYNSPINLVPSPDCYICIGLLVDTHIGPNLSHNGIRPYGHMAIFWGYDHIALLIFPIKFINELTCFNGVCCLYAFVWVFDLNLVIDDKSQVLFAKTVY